MGLVEYNQAEIIKDYDLFVDRLSDYGYQQLRDIDLNAYIFPLSRLETNNLTETLNAWENVVESEKTTLKLISKWVDKYKTPFTHELKKNIEAVLDQMRYVMEQIIEIDWDTLEYDLGLAPDSEPEINEDLFHHRRDRLGDGNA